MDKTHENRLRRMAARQGLRLIKSRSRDSRAMDYGLYALVDIQTNILQNQPFAGHWECSWTAEQVESYLTE